MTLFLDHIINRTGMEVNDVAVTLLPAWTIAAAKEREEKGPTNSIWLQTEGARSSLARCVGGICCERTKCCLKLLEQLV